MTIYSGANQDPLLKPVNHADEFNVAAPGVNTDILGADLTPTHSPSRLRVTVLLATESVFKARVARSGTTFDADFNGGSALKANSLYTFDLVWMAEDAVNFQVETDGVIQKLQADEIGASS